MRGQPSSPPGSDLATIPPEGGTNRPPSSVGHPTPAAQSEAPVAGLRLSFSKAGVDKGVVDELPAAAGSVADVRRCSAEPRRILDSL